METQEIKSIKTDDACPVTGEPILDLFMTLPFWHYTITDQKNSVRHHIRMGFQVEPAAFGQGHDPVTFEYVSWNNDIWYRRNKHLLFYAFKNDIRLFNHEDLITVSLLQQKLRLSTVPQTASAKLDWVLKGVNAAQESAGLTTCLKGKKENGSIFLVSPLYKWYMKDEAELMFYLNTLRSKDLVEFDYSEPLWPVSLTYEGLSYLAAMEKDGPSSKKCFLAMSFSDARKPFGDIIIEAIKATGYNPIIVNREDIASDQTINDRIIAGIRESKFCIADFTEQRNGIYFEAGFALGLNRPVIYVCDNDDFAANSHFDLKPFQHILYRTGDELRQSLEAKIRAWIQ